MCVWAEGEGGVGGEERVRRGGCEEGEKKRVWEGWGVEGEWGLSTRQMGEGAQGRCEGGCEIANTGGGDGPEVEFLREACDEVRGNE